MNNTFLKYIAEDLIKRFGHNMARIAIVFPNKRASLFLNMELAKLTDNPIWSPSYITISELFRQYSSLEIGDQIKLICDLYKVFISVVHEQGEHESPETLDHFYGWGQLLLADFDDLDKNMADAHQVFVNLSNIHELDGASYLSAQQKKILERFWGSLGGEVDSLLKKRFLNLWKNLETIYNRYKEHLCSQHIAYEGMLYRQVVERQELPFEYDYYVFIGFNMVQTVEKKLFNRLKKQGKALFYWDFDEYFCHDNQNEAGRYIRECLNDFPNALDSRNPDIYAHIREKKDICYIDAPTENVQARYVSSWLRENNRYKDGRKTAIVLADESLLPTVINCLPPEIENVNITLGYPLTSTPTASLVTQLFFLQTSGRSSKSKYRLHYVQKVLRHPYASYISEASTRLSKNLKEANNYYPSIKELAVDDNLGHIFGFNTEITNRNEFNDQLLQWIMQILQQIAIASKDEAEPLMKESLFQMYTILNRVHGLIADEDLVVDAETLRRLIGQLIQSTSIPFHGEPVVGVQIMGVLETRNLDFEHILVLSCNEGNLPKGVNDASFIPYSIRKAFNLTTIDNKIAIYAYYFYSLLQRTSDITFTFNSSTNDGHVGEMSRFMLQLMIEWPHSIRQYALSTQLSIPTHQYHAVAKNERVLEILNSKSVLYPSSLNRYIRCQLRFYYNDILGLREPDASDIDEIDNRVFGNIFHKAAELVYQRMGSEIHQEQLELLLRHPNVQVEAIVDEAFRLELFKASNENFHPEYNGLQLINRKVIIDYILTLLRLDQKLAPFTINDVEKMVSMPFSFEAGGQSHQLTIGGVIDRLDQIDDGHGPRLRVIDYKTGASPRGDIKDIAELFTPAGIKQKHSDYFLQAFLYALIVSQDKEINPHSLPISPALLFIQHTGNEDYDPTLCLAGKPVSDIRIHQDAYMDGLKALLSEIFNPKIPFVPTENKGQCANCPYHQICG